MIIDIYFDPFIKKRFPNGTDLRKTAITLLKGEKPYSLTQMPDYQESSCLQGNIRDSVRQLPRGKDSAIKVYKGLVSFLHENGVDTDVKFPPVPIDISLERQIFIAKYLQKEDARIEELEEILWVSKRTIDDDLSRLYNKDNDDPIQICGRRFFIPDTARSKGQVHFASTVHPVFLTENLTQIIVMLKGLKEMAKDPLYKYYAEASAADIWQQLSEYAKNRIHFVLGELLPEDLSWYENLEASHDSTFATEQQCSVCGNVLLDCLKNAKPFFVEYQADSGTEFYKECRFTEHPFCQDDGDTTIIEVECTQGRKLLEKHRIVRSTYTIEELLSD